MLNSVLYASAARENGFGDIPDRLDLFVHAVETDDPARTRFETFVTEMRR